jgi:hypothetical protein
MRCCMSEWQVVSILNIIAPSDLTEHQLPIWEGRVRLQYERLRTIQRLRTLEAFHAVLN